MPPVTFCWGHLRLSGLESSARDASVLHFSPSRGFRPSCFAVLCCQKQPCISGCTLWRIACLHRDLNRIFLLLECSHFHANAYLAMLNILLQISFFLLRLSLWSLFVLRCRKKPQGETPHWLAVLLDCSSAVPVLSEQEKVITIL